METRPRLRHSRIRDGALGRHAGMEQYDTRAFESTDRSITLEKTVGLSVIYKICQDTDNPFGVLETPLLHANALMGVNTSECR